MAHPKYGEKFSCFQCGTKFYNMGAPKPVCPKCGANQRKAPKGKQHKSSRQIAVPDFETEDEQIDQELEVLPVKEDDNESFNPETDRISVDGTPDQEC